MPSKKAHVSLNSGNNEWFTPPEHIQAAREVLGEIDLDPASNPLANCIVGASIYYHKDDDGLSKKWQGRVYMNPPFENRLIKQFVDKLILHVAAGDVTEAIVLVNNATETAWFNTLVTHAAAVVFTRGRIRFLDDQFTRLGAPLQGQAFIYFGARSDKFLESFSKFGWGALIEKEATR